MEFSVTYSIPVVEVTLCTVLQLESSSPPVHDAGPALADSIHRRTRCRCWQWFHPNSSVKHRQRNAAICRERPRWRCRRADFR